MFQCGWFSVWLRELDGLSASATALSRSPASRALHLLVLPWLALQVERDGRRPARLLRPYELGVVPGATVYADGTASGALRRRVERAAELWHQGAFPTLLISGRGRGGRTEASVGAELAESFGVPSRHLIREELAMSTAENARLSRAMVSVERVLVVTDTTHVRRCRKLFSAHFSEVGVAGVPLATRSRIRMAFREAVIEAWRG